MILSFFHHTTTHRLTDDLLVEVFFADFSTELPQQIPVFVEILALCRKYNCATYTQTYTSNKRAIKEANIKIKIITVPNASSLLIMVSPIFII